LVTGKITKQSVMSAVNRGIAVDLIIDFLEQYAHSLMKQNEPVLPINVVDQMRLWEAEGQRMKVHSAFMICLIPTDAEFDEFIRIVTGRDCDERATLLADNAAPDQLQNIIQNIDAFVNEHNKIKSKAVDSVEVEDDGALKALLDESLPPSIETLMRSMDEQSQHTVKSRYAMILTKFGWNGDSLRFTKKLDVNDLMKLSDELCAVHLTKAQMLESASKLLWSSKAEKTMVCTVKGRDVLKRHRAQKRKEKERQSQAQNVNANVNVSAVNAPPRLPPRMGHAPRPPPRSYPH